MGIVVHGPNPRVLGATDAAVVAEPVAEEPVTPEQAAAVKVTRKRAHRKDGTFRADDPATPGVNEAWADGKAES